MSCPINPARAALPPTPPAVKDAIATLRQCYYGGAGANIGISTNPDGTITRAFYDEGEGKGRVLFAITYTPEGPELEKHRRDLAVRLAWQEKRGSGEALNDEERALEETYFPKSAVVA